jgi:hypothetical protein
MFMIMKGGKGCFAGWDLDQGGAGVKVVSCFLDTNFSFECWRNGNRVKKTLGYNRTAWFCFLGIALEE